MRTAMANRRELRKAYEAIFLQELRGEITREECLTRVIALRDSRAAAGLSVKQRDDIANEAVKRAEAAANGIEPRRRRAPP
jgi:hypothetical protein